MIENIKTGDEVILKNNDYYDVLTVMKVSNDTIECFEHDPRKVFIVKKDEVELI